MTQSSSGRKLSTLSLRKSRIRRSRGNKDVAKAIVVQGTAPSGPDCGKAGARSSGRWPSAHAAIWKNAPDRRRRRSGAHHASPLRLPSPSASQRAKVAGRSGIIRMPDGIVAELPVKVGGLVPSSAENAEEGSTSTEFYRARIKRGRTDLSCWRLRPLKKQSMRRSGSRSRTRCRLSTMGIAQSAPP
jgi:hypothetical protein